MFEKLTKNNWCKKKPLPCYCYEHGGSLRMGFTI